MIGKIINSLFLFIKKELMASLINFFINAMSKRKKVLYELWVYNFNKIKFEIIYIKDKIS